MAEPVDPEGHAQHVSFRPSNIYNSDEAREFKALMTIVNNSVKATVQNTGKSFGRTSGFIETKVKVAYGTRSENCFERCLVKGSTPSHSFSLFFKSSQQQQQQQQQLSKSLPNMALGFFYLEESVASRAEDTIQGDSYYTRLSATHSFCLTVGELCRSGFDKDPDPRIRAVHFDPEGDLFCLDRGSFKRESSFTPALWDMTVGVTMSISSTAVTLEIKEGNRREKQYSYPHPFTDTTNMLPFVMITSDKAKNANGLMFSLGSTSSLEWQVSEYLDTDIRDERKLYLDDRIPKLTAVPTAIRQMNNLMSLDLRGNLIDELPEILWSLTNLEELLLHQNRLTSLPESVGQLKSLKQLDVSSNQLRSLPGNIGDLRGLTDLNVSVNQLTSLPSSIGELRGLTDLNVSVNQLTSLPSSIGELCNLKTLKIHTNLLEQLPQEMADLPAGIDVTFRAFQRGRRNILNNIPTELRDGRWAAIHQYLKTQQICFLGVYNFGSQTKWVYKSSTCEVWFADDSEHGPVALKIFHSEVNFRREREKHQELKAALKQRLRRKVDEDEDKQVMDQLKHLVLPVLREHEEPELTPESLRVLRDSGFQNGGAKGILVLQRGGRNLQEAFSAELLTGNIEQVRLVAKQIAEKLRLLHSMGFVHCDVKGRNIVRVDFDWRLIDLDASSLIQGGKAGYKCSQAFCPPEMIHKIEGGFAICPNCPASVAIDMWSFGCVLYHLCCKRSLWNADDEDGLLPSDMERLAQWNDHRLGQMLSNVPVSDGFGLADDLLSQLLQSDPHRRPKNMSEVLRHNFFHPERAMGVVLRPVIARLDNIDAHLDELGSQLLVMNRKILKILHKHLEKQGCPSLAIIIPADEPHSTWSDLASRVANLDFLTTKWKLFFIDAVTLSIADSGKGGKGYDFKMTLGFIPLAKAITQSVVEICGLVSKYGGFLGLSLPAAMKVVGKGMEVFHEIRAQAKYFKSFLELCESMQLNVASQAEARQELDLQTYQKVVKVVEEQDPGLQYTGLTKAFCEKFGTFAWVLPKYVKDYEQMGDQILGNPPCDAACRKRPPSDDRPDSGKRSKTNCWIQ